MRINWVGNFDRGYVGEVGDSVHLVRELRALGHTVQEVPQDIWKAICDGEYDLNWKDRLPIEADINIICKWHYFDKRMYIEKLRETSKAPVFYWVWDYMNDQKLPLWHLEMIDAADLYLGNDVRDESYLESGLVYGKRLNLYYFPFDVSDGEIPHYSVPEAHKLYDVVFFGSCIGQGDRIAWLEEINKTHKVKIFAWNYEDWIKRGFDASPAVYGKDFADTVGYSRVILGFSVEANCWGYWSNRVGKVLNSGGFLLYQYAPGMELFLRDGVEYFSSVEEANEKITQYLKDSQKRNEIARKGHEIAQERFTSKERVKDLVILAERFIKTQGKGWQI